ncbi:MAG: hypothetical protein LBN38_02915 [Verrucomicrobiota bacterium]|nr:hypothetical protein [Verrucomicrobiota bacterium]
MEKCRTKCALPPEGAAFRLERWFYAAAWAVFAVLSGWAAWRIMSYATGQDVRIYFYWADRILDARFSPSVILKCARLFVPGYPLLLAAGKAAAGYFAVYWINVPLLWLGCWALGRALRAESALLETSVALLVFFVLTFTGYALNPHFLLLPFRGVVEWTFIFGVMAAALPALKRTLPARRRLACACAAGWILLAGAGFRETVVFVLAPLSLFAVGQGLRGDRSAWGVLGLMWLPLGLGAALLLGIRWWQGEPLLHNQIHIWWTYASTGKVRGGWLKDILRVIGGQLHPTGVVFLGVGVWAALRRRAKGILCLLLLSALLIIFYAQYKTLHMRYVLSAVGPLAWVAGWGLAVCLSRVTRALRAEWRMGVFTAVLVALTAWGACAVLRMESWGPAVGRADVRRLAAHPLAQADRVYLDASYRYMTDALLTFTQVQPVDVVRSGDWRLPDGGGTAFLILPREENGAFPLPSGVRQEDWLRHHQDWLPVEAPLLFGGVVWDVFREAPRMAGRREVAVSIPSAGKIPGVLWLNFKSGTTAADVRLEWTPAEGEVLTFHLARPSGWVPLWLPAEAAMDGRLGVEADLPYPHELSPLWVPAGTIHWFALEQGRSPSVLPWLADGFLPRGHQEKYGASVVSNAIFRLPTLVGAPVDIEWRISLNVTMNPPSPTELNGVLYPEHHPEKAQEWGMRKGKPNHKIQWRGPLPEEEDPAWVLMITHGLEEGRFLRVEHIGIGVEPLAGPGTSP